MAERRATVKSPVGLHARPAALFVQAAAKVPFAVSIAKSGGGAVNAKSILQVLSLDVRGSEEVVLSADGPDAETHLEALAAVIETEA